MAAPLYIFDLDGTLALIDHRRHLVEGKKKDWDAFYKACIYDTPNRPVIGMMLQLYACGADIRIWSGRGSEVRGLTVEWLYINAGLQPHAVEKMLTMRPEGDYTPDDQMKKKWLNLLSKEDRDRLGGVFDDRDKVVKMWRDNGVCCFQVAEGAF